MTITGRTPSTDNNPRIYNFPTAFANIPLVVHSAIGYDISSATYVGYVDRITNNGFRYVVKGSDGSSRLEGVFYSATGKWK